VNGWHCDRRMRWGVRITMANGETREFQTEVRQLLDIVINSLYTDREIFLRELISNAADALEKVRYLQIIGEETQDKDLALEISIEADKDAHTITVTDTGVGLTKEELVENLGTIAHSGSKEFLKRLAAGAKQDVNLIGQFGVGFYAAFMVAKKVTLYTRSYRPEAGSFIWVSEGMGSYTIEETGGLPRGTKIVLELKDGAQEFAEDATVKRIIRQYSSFVPYPIKVNGENLNTVQALWTKNKNEIKEEEYAEFYKYIANAFDEPLYRLHFSSDAPLNLNALLFVPKDNFERYGLGRTEPGVNVYCKKVLIQEQSQAILPEWLRFIKGVVDSEELPLNISRETMQDSSLVAKINRVVTRQLLRFLDEQAGEDAEKYKEFWDKFGMFIREGAATDFDHRNDLVKLLRFESSKTEAGKLTSLADYVTRMKEEQTAIYYVNGPSREAIEAGPYMEVFRQHDLEVLYTREPVDDYILGLLGDFQGKKLISADQANLGLEAAKEEREALSESEVQSLATWLKEVLGAKVTEVRPSKRLVDSPAIVLSPYGAYSMQRMMQLMNREADHFAGPSILEINAHHPLIKRLSSLKGQDEPFARMAAEQILENAQIAAGLIVDPRGMVTRLYAILERAIG